MPVLSMGGMRFQQSWNDVNESQISSESQENLEHILRKGVHLGFNHLETARHYGSSERQIGLALKNCPNPKRLLQTKIPPHEDANVFEAELELSFKRLRCERLDLLAIHGINLPIHLEQTLCAGGCLEVVRRWQKNGLIGHVGFSTHAPTELIIHAMQSNQFDYVNLHWYFINQQNESALELAKKLDLGVFIISPTDKGGHLHSPSSKLLDLCAPLHPIIFNDLFCLSDKRVHTISVGPSNPQALDLHLQAIDLLSRSNEFVPAIERKLNDQAIAVLGESWFTSWWISLPRWQETPGQINIPVLLWLYNLLEAWEMESYVKARYSLLGNGGHWFPGANADCLDNGVNEEDLKKVLSHSPWSDQIPDLLRKLRSRVGGGTIQRLANF